MAINYTYSDLSKMIDHSLLNPTLTGPELESGIVIAKAYDVASVCILPYALAHLSEQLQGTTVKSSTTIGFPHGAVTTASKVAESELAIKHGCQELDMVVNISQVRTHQWSEVKTDIRAVVDVAHAAGQKVKVIFENCYLADEEKIRLCEICAEVSADWVKTSTGYGSGGATIEDLILMRKHSPETVQVKAAGGIRELDKLLQVQELGVSRCGATATKVILDEARVRLGLSPIDSGETQAVAGY